MKANGQKISLVSAAVKVLSKTSKPMSADDIVEKAKGCGWKPGAGLTPAATLAAAMMREARDSESPRFAKVGRGLWTLASKAKAKDIVTPGRAGPRKPAPKTKGKAKAKAPKAKRTAKAK